MMPNAPAVRGQPRVFLQLEGGTLLAFATVIYAWSGASWWIFGAFFFAPDLAFLAYIVGQRTGAIVYNAAHTTLAPALLVALAVVLDHLILAQNGQPISATTVCSAMGSNIRRGTS
jgi:Domain of unknown function (DUF4260)